MGTIVAFFTGLFFGGLFGFLCAALVVAAGEAENRGDDDGK